MSGGRLTVGEAMAKAEAAHAKMSAHEDLCSLRYGHINEALKDLKDAVSNHGKAQVESMTNLGRQQKDDIQKIYWFLWGVAGTVVLILMGCVAALLKPHLGLP